MTFVAAYWWKTKPGCETQFREAWRQGTGLIRERYGSLGSRLHYDQQGRFVGVAEWPNRATWQRAFDAKMVYDDPIVRSAFLDALEDRAEEPFLLMEVCDDLLDR
ncbi:antibiotic biosynthesis monooxygenase [Erythrobacter sp.]|uniref:antibiotic biosynthesis monooxygenase n=1 Tax=Erythrobacter sp. TaxID=1042 RepID=UPI00311FC131